MANKFKTWDFQFWLTEIYGVSKESWAKKSADEKEEIYSEYELSEGSTGLGIY